MVADFVDHHARILPGRQWDPDSETGLWTCWVGLLHRWSFIVHRLSFIVHRWPLRTICPGSGLLLPERDDRATRLRRSWSSHTGPVSTGRASGGPPGVRPLRYRNGSLEFRASGGPPGVRPLRYRNGSLEFRTFRGATGLRPLRHRNGPFAPSVPLYTLPKFPSVPLFSIFFFIF